MFNKAYIGGDIFVGIREELYSKVFVIVMGFNLFYGLRTKELSMGQAI